ncbi:LPXTG cell wall anchor domain-containing protein [Cerasibacillus sp.]|uniref:LPXTG cell wall anchor domain-containing protein n=1 Tax=Cerasibacillus sp. TaxID=2498711 RepID=UPI0039C88405
MPDSLKDFLEENASSDNLDIEWDGNTAFINLDTVKGTQWHQGFLTALGESSEPLEDLEGLEVVVTLYQNGTEVVEQLNIPFVIVHYEGEPGEDPGEGEDPGKGDSSTPGEDKDFGKGEPGHKSGDKQETKTDGDGSQLPKTATNMFNLIMIGSALMVAGVGIMLFKRRKIA